MKILVTGGVGFIGTNLIKRLVSEGHEVHSLDNYDSGTKDNEIKGVTYINTDIESVRMWGNDFDLCYHLCALSRIQPSFNNPSETFRVNTYGTQVVCEWARENGVKLVYAGSSSRWHNPEQSPYANSKKLGEDIVKMYNNVYNTNFQIVRFYNVYGPNEIVDGDWAALIGKWRGLIKNNITLEIVGDGEQRRDFTHVDDIVDGLYRIGNTHIQKENGWELGTGNNYSINEVYEMFLERFPNTSVVWVPQQKGNYRETIRENDDTLELLGWLPKDKLKEWILTYEE